MPVLSPPAAGIKAAVAMLFSFLRKTSQEYGNIPRILDLYNTLLEKKCS